MSQAESRNVLETFWRNVYLRGQMIFDPDGRIARDAYGQPNTGLPFGRSFVIGPDQRVVLPQFGHDPDLVIDTIYELLATMPCPGDLNGDGRTDLADLGILLADFGCTAPGPCAGDLDGDGDTDLADLGILLADFGCTP